MIIWDIDSLTAEAKKYKSRGEFSTKSKSAYETARKLDVLDKDYIKEI